jgi:hypothetical protein
MYKVDETWGRLMYYDTIVTICNWGKEEASIINNYVRTYKYIGRFLSIRISQYGSLDPI